MVLAFVWAPAATAAVTLPPEFADQPVTAVGAPTALAFTPDGRLLITTQPGRLRIHSGGNLLAAPVLDLSSRVCSGSERGLLGVAVDPGFAVNRFIYLFYTWNKFGSCATNSPSSPVNRVSRFTLGDTNTVDPASEELLIDNMPSPNGNHNGGDLQFGKDGNLYVTVGDGGCDYAGGGCAGSNDAARDQHVLTGKVLRITPDGGIPPGNPFQGSDSARCAVTGRTDPGKKCQETFAGGLRNPFRFAFDPNATGTRFYINDVGQNNWEEIDDGQAGADYGWNVREGRCATGSSTNCGAPPAGMTNPVYDYDRSTGCGSITGGAFVPNGTWPVPYEGAYLFADYVCGTIFRLVPQGDGTYTRSTFASGLGASSAVHMRFGPAGSDQALYYTTYAGGGEVRRIFHTATNRPPTADLTVSPTTGAAPLDVTLDGSGSGDPDAGDTLTYIWDFGDGSPTTETSSTTTTHGYAAGSYTAKLTVRDNQGATSSPDSARIDSGNTAPEPTIQSPAAGQRFAVGETLTLTGSASDPEEGALPASSLSWTVIRHHADHTHPYVGPTQGNGIPIVGPAPEDLAATTNSYQEVLLTATDAQGLSATVTRRVDPRPVDLTFDTEPSGLNLAIEGSTFGTPRTFTSWEAWDLSISAPTQGGYSFSSWSDGGAATHTIHTPASARTYRATMQAAAPLAPGYAASVAADNPAGYWRLGESSGTTAADSAGSNAGAYFNGAVLGAPSLLGSDTANRSVTLDGSNDYVRISHSASLNLSTQLTLEAWVRPTVIPPSGGGAAIIYKPEQYALQFEGPLLDFTIIQFGTRRRLQAPAGALRAGQTYHVVGTFDGTTRRLYVNGAQVASATLSGGATSTTNGVFIGSWSGTSDFLRGTVDEVAVYPAALSATRVKAHYDAATNSAPVPPVASPSGLTATAASASAINLTWSDNATNETSFVLERDTNSNFSSPVAVSLPASTTTHTSSGLSASTTYHYRVRALNASTTSGWSNTANATTQAPPPVGAPTSLAASATSPSAINLTWSDNASNETSFVLERDTNSSFTSPVAISLPANTTSHTSSGLSASTTYYYRVRALNSSTTSGWSNTANMATQAPPPVGAPTNLAASATSPSAINLTWSDNASNETSFVLERDTNSSFTSPVAISLPANTTSHTSSGLSASTTYQYRVRALNASTTSGWSNTATATTAPPPPAPAYAATVAADNPAGYWRLGETSGTAALDQKGVNHGAYFNGAVLGAPSLLGSDTANRSVTLDGSNDYVRISHSASLNLSTQLTLEAWVRPTVIPPSGGGAAIIYKPEQYALQFEGPLLDFTIIQFGTRRRLQAPAGALRAGQTYHVVGTFDGTTRRLYVNGAQVASATLSGGATSTTNGVFIGSWSGTSDFLRGTVDEVAVYGTALSAARVLAHRNAGL